MNGVLASLGNLPDWGRIAFSSGVVSGSLVAPFLDRIMPAEAGAAR